MNSSLSCIPRVVTFACGLLLAAGWARAQEGLNVRLVPMLTVTGAVGVATEVQYADALGDTNRWLALTNLVLPSSPYALFDTDLPEGGRRFYRTSSLDSTPVTNLIGQAGGQIENLGFTVAFPPQMFANPAPLVLTPSADRPFGRDSRSGSFALSGLPRGVSGTVTIRFKADGSPGPFHVVTRVEVPSRDPDAPGDTSFAYELFEAELVGDEIVAQLPVEKLWSPWPARGGAGLQGPAPSPTPAGVGVVAGYTTFVTADGHFRVQHPNRLAADRIVLLEDALHQAQAVVYDTLKFNTNVFNTKRPISVIVKDFGQANSDNFMYGQASGSQLKINSDQNLANAGALRQTVGHEFLHIVQGFNESFWQTLWAYTYWWDEATAVWIEEYFGAVGLPDLLTSPFAGTDIPRSYAPLYGFANTAHANNQQHGYGMAGLAKYLMNKYASSNIIANIFETQLAAHTSAIDAIQAGVRAVDPSRPKVEDWTADFFKEYLLNQVYDGLVQTLYRQGEFLNSNDVFQVETGVPRTRDIGLYVERHGAGLIPVRLNEPDIDESAALIVTNLAPQNCKLLAIKARTLRTLEFAAEGDDYLVVENLKDLMNPNAASIKPYIFLLAVNTGTGPWSKDFKVAVKSHTLGKRVKAFPTAASRVLGLRLNVPDVALRGRDLNVTGTWTAGPNASYSIQYGFADAADMWTLSTFRVKLGTLGDAVTGFNVNLPVPSDPESYLKVQITARGKDSQTAEPNVFETWIYRVPIEDP